MILRITLALLLICSAAAYGQTPNSIVVPQAITNGHFSFIGGTHAVDTLQTIFTAGAAGARCNGIMITNNDPATHAVSIGVENTAVFRTLATVTTVVNQGFVTGTNALAPLTSVIFPGLPLDSNGNVSLQLKSGDTLRMKYATALTGTNRIEVYVSCLNL